MAERKRKMNKLFSKIATLSVGLAMAIGVGVAVGSKGVVRAKAATAEFTLSSASDVTVSGVTVSFGKGSGSSAPAWYAAGLRLYASNTVTVSSSDPITGITFNWEKQGSKAFATVSANTGNYSHPSAAGEGVWTGSASEVVFTLGSSGQLQLNTLSAETGGEDLGELISLAISGSMTKTNYTTADAAWDPSGFVVTGTYENGQKVVTSSVDWSYDHPVPAEGVTSLIVTATIGEISANSAAQAVTVTAAPHAGTAADPFTVAEALAKCSEIGAIGNKGQGPWVTKGIISRVTSAPAATYWNATYYISDDGTQSNELQVYRGFYLDNAKFDAETALLLTSGKIVTVTGNLTGSYGSEYCQGNYLLAIEEQETGDVDVSFEPESTSIEIGASGTFSASSETSGAVFTWSVDNSSVLTVDENTGAFEAVGLGVARVTVTASAGGKEGSTYADITVNGSEAITIAEANTIAAALPSSGASSTSSYYVYVGGYVKEFATDVKDDKPRALDIFSLDEESSIMVYTNINSYADFVDGLALGDYIVVKAKIQNYSGKYELVNPERVGNASKTCLSFVFEFKSYTEGGEGICTDYDGETSNKAAFEAIWEGLEGSYNALSGEEKALLVSMDGCGDTLINAMGLYDYVVGKYELKNFVAGRTPVVFRADIEFNVSDSNSLMLIIIAVAATSAIALGALLIFKKKKHQ